MLHLQCLDHWPHAAASHSYVPRSGSSCLRSRIIIWSSRLAAGLMVQQRCGLRPGELLQIEPQCIVLPHEQSEPAYRGVAVIGLGVRSGTNVKRSQAVLVRQHEDPGIYRFAKILTTPEGQRCTPYSLYQMR